MDPSAFVGLFTGGKLLGGSSGNLTYSAGFVFGSLDSAVLTRVDLPLGNLAATDVLTFNLRLVAGDTFVGSGCVNAAGAPVACTGEMTTGNLTLTYDPPGNGTVPERGTLTLLGTGLLIMAGFFPRKLRKS